MARRRRPPRSGALTELPPLKILSQMAALQGLYYALALLLMAFDAVVSGTHFSVDLVFGWTAVRGDTTQGWLMGFLWVLDGGLFMAVAMVYLVARSKLVLDFAVSLHVIHLLVVTLYTGQLPRHTAWWLVMAGASALAVAIGTWGCRHRELRPVFFGGGASATAGGNREGSSAVGQDSLGYGDEEDGPMRGRGRSRGRDDEYEMGKMHGGVVR